MVFRRKIALLLTVALPAVLVMSSCSTPEGFAGDDLSTSLSAASATQLHSESASAAPPSASPTPTQVPAPTEDEVRAAMAQTDILTFIPADTYEREEGQRWYEPVIEREETTLALPDRYMEWLNTASGALHFEDVSDVQTEFTAPTWPLLAAIVANYTGDPEGMRTALMQAGGIASSAEETDSGYVLNVTAYPVDPDTLFYALPESSVTNAFSLVLSYAYLATVFDESLHGREGIGEPDLEQLLFPMAAPDRYYVGDCWGDPRDGGARVHTGTDINAPEGTDLLACVDGTILFNGTDPVAGNYIVLLGEDGTQYHYYHMVELSDVPVGTAVETGDVIGHVGNTGNSRANHLHFTIVTSDGYYINPVTYLQRAQRETVDGIVVSAAERRAAEEAAAQEAAEQHAAEEAAALDAAAQAAELVAAAHQEAVQTTQPSQETPDAAQ